MSPPRMTTASGYSISCPGLFPVIARGRRARPLLRAAKHQPDTKRHALFGFEVAEVADEHDAVARRDAEHRHKADHRAERHHARADGDREYPADEREWDREGNEQRRSPRAEIDEQ